MEILLLERPIAVKYKYDWNASGPASRAYLYGIKAGIYVEAKKMLLMK